MNIVRGVLNNYDSESFAIAANNKYEIIRKQVENKSENINIKNIIELNWRVDKDEDLEKEEKYQINLLNQIIKINDFTKENIDNLIESLKTYK